MSDTTTTPPADTAAVDDAREQADFADGFDGDNKPADKTTGKPDNTDTPSRAPKPAVTPRVEATPAPEYVQITAKDWAEVQAAARRTASYDGQFSKLFGTTGNIQKVISGLQAQTPAGRKVEIPRDAFAAMERDFPELAQQTRSALEAALSGIHGTGANDADPAKLESMLSQYAAKRELEILEDAHPDWRDLVGAVDVSRGMQPDPANPFRKWLAGKPADYQDRVNGSESAAIISRAIRTFQKETASAPKNGAPRSTDARADRIRSAIQPRGDAQGTPAGKNEDDMFEEGFRSR